MSTHRPAIWLAMVVLLAACSPGGDPAVSGDTPTTSSIDPAGATGVIADLPPGTRETTGGGDPRSPTYWIDWSTCGDNSRADEAAANGGAAAGWYLLDDVLTEPGLGLGEHPIATCDEAAAILDPPDDAPFDELASLLLAADLNLSSGAETCEAADQAVQAAHLALAGLGYAGPGTVDVEPGLAALQLIDLLTAYDAGELCR